MGVTDVWTSDFDNNGRQDLLISTFDIGNGRCIDGATIYILMFDQFGRPVPWVAKSYSFEVYGRGTPTVGFNFDSGRPPLPIIDTNGNKRAEIITLDCEYCDPKFGVGEDRRITGIYEAKDARWVPMRKISVLPYLAVAKRHLGKMSKKRYLLNKWWRCIIYGTNRS
jgi:hypothetical protein